MTNEVISLLVVDDNETNLDMLSRRLQRKGYSVSTACDGPSALELIEAEPFDLVLLDLMMPGMSGLEVLERIRQKHTVAEMPVIMVTAKHDSSTVVEALDAGASDYVTKPIDFPVLFARIQPQLSRKQAELALVEANQSLEKRVEERTSDLEAANRSLAEEAAIRRQAEEQSRLLLESTAEAICGVDNTGACTFCNPASLQLFGGTNTEEYIGQNFIELALKNNQDSQGLDGADNPILKAIREGKSAHSEDMEFGRADGSTRSVECWTRPMIRDGEPAGAVITFVDITQRKLIDERLRESQKLEAVGQLAGGIAHEFNNLLMIIGGFVEKAMKAAANSEQVVESLLEVRKAANRAGTLTKQLLVFSRKPVFERKVFNISESLRSIRTLLGPVLEEQFEFDIEIADEEAFVNIDPDQLTQAVINLVINAREAMPTGGRITLGCSLDEPDPDEARSGDGDAVSDTRVVVYVADQGMGMDEPTKKRIFEPFFTTKPPGEGTGLGLAMVFGFVEQSNGFIDVESTPGKGSVFTLSFPKVRPVALEEQKTDDEIPTGNGEVVLIVEDEAPLRKLLCDELEGLGYQVLSAGDGPQALEIEMDQEGPIDLLLSDLVMPGFGGIEVAKAMIQTQTQMKVILMSGYPTAGNANYPTPPEGIPFLSKPVDPSTLAIKIREVLNEKNCDARALLKKSSKTRLAVPESDHDNIN